MLKEMLGEGLFGHIKTRKTRLAKTKSTNSHVFSPIPLEFLPFMSYLPDGVFGTWATIIKEMPLSIQKLGFNKMDIVFIHNEQVPTPLGYRVWAMGVSSATTKSALGLSVSFGLIHLSIHLLRNIKQNLKHGEKNFHI